MYSISRINLFNSLNAKYHGNKKRCISYTVPQPSIQKKKKIKENYINK